MILKLFQGGRPIASYCQYIVDTEADVSKIKILPNGGSMGNEVYVIETQKIYVLDSKGMWRSRVAGDNSSIEGDCCCDHVEESTIWEEIGETNNTNL